MPVRVGSPSEPLGDDGTQGHEGGRITLPADGVVLEDLEAELIAQALRRSGGKLEPA